MLVLRLTDFNFPDTFSNDGSTVLLSPTGVKLDGLTAEFSDTFTFGFDYKPEGMPGLDISATYFSIDYKDRLAVPVNSSLALTNQDEFGFAFNTSPELAEITAIFDALGSTVIDRTGLLSDPTTPQEIVDLGGVLLDQRLTNVDRAKSEGIDAKVNYRRSLNFGEVNFGANLTYTIESTQQASPDEPELSQLNFVGRPVSLKGRLYTGFSRDGWSGQLNMNYVDSYRDRTASPEEPVDSWTTFDLNLRYAFGADREDLLGKTVVSLTMQNLFDADPPEVGLADVARLDGLTIPVGYDPVNANPLGRIISIGLTKQF